MLHIKSNEAAVIVIPSIYRYIVSFCKDGGLTDKQVTIIKIGLVLRVLDNYHSSDCTAHTNILIEENVRFVHNVGV